MVDGEFQTIVARGPEYLREKIFGDDPQLKALVAGMKDKQIWQMTRGGHDPRKVYAAYAAAHEHKGQPTVILVNTIKGFGMGQAGESVMVAHNVKKMDLESLKVFRDRFSVPLEDDKLADLPFIRPPQGSAEERFIKERREALGGPVPSRKEKSEPLKIPKLDAFSRLLASSKTRELSTTMAFVRLLGILVKDKEIGKHIVPIIPDEARTFGMEGLFRQLGIYAPTGQTYEPQDSESISWYREDPAGQILEEGITEAGAVSSWLAAATSHANHDIPMIPFYAFYSMFGFQRIGDQLWAAGDSRARGFLMGATAGRTTLNGEGLQHQDGHALLFASAYPSCRAYDPAFSYEVAILIQQGMRRMFAENEDVFYYITLLNENYPQPEMLPGIEDDLEKGMYLFKKGAEQKLRVQLMGSGSILREVIAAAEILEEKYAVAADIWSVPGINQLHREGLLQEDWNRAHPEEPPQQSFVAEKLAAHDGPVILSTDYVQAYGEQIRRFIDRPFTVLGTDGYGRSDSRQVLRHFFKVDRYHVVVAALRSLADLGSLDITTVRKAQEEFGLDAETPHALER